MWYYWKRTNPDGSTKTVESYDFNQAISGAIKITETEYNAFISSLPVPVTEPTRDLAAELDELKIKVTTLETKIVK